LHFQAEALLLQEAFYANCADRFRGVDDHAAKQPDLPELAVSQLSHAYRGRIQVLKSGKAGMQRPAFLSFTGQQLIVGGDDGR